MHVHHYVQRKIYHHPEKPQHVGHHNQLKCPVIVVKYGYVKHQLQTVCKLLLLLLCMHVGMYVDKHKMEVFYIIHYLFSVVSLPIYEVKWYIKLLVKQLYSNNLHNIFNNFAEMKCLHLIFYTCNRMFCILLVIQIKSFREQSKYQCRRCMHTIF